MFKRRYHNDKSDKKETEILLSRGEQQEAFKQCTDMVMSDTRWVLDNLEKLPEFKVGWENYGKNRKRYQGLKVLEDSSV